MANKRGLGGKGKAGMTRQTGKLKQSMGGVGKLPKAPKMKMGE
jgi:hypothetical protein